MDNFNSDSDSSESIQPIEIKHLNHAVCSKFHAQITRTWHETIAFSTDLTAQALVENIWKQWQLLGSLIMQCVESGEVKHNIFNLIEADARHWTAKIAFIIEVRLRQATPGTEEHRIFSQQLAIYNTINANFHELIKPEVFDETVQPFVESVSAAAEIDPLMSSVILDSEM